MIVDAIRTPLARRNGQLRDWHPVDLAAEMLTALADRNELDPALVDDVVLGCVMQVGEQAANVARNAVLAAGWPESVPGTTVDRQCGSSQQAAHFAAQGVIAGVYDVVVAGGVEVMTRVPMGASMMDGKYGWPFGPAVGARYAEQGGLVPQGISAEMIADRWEITRDELDAYGLRSQQFAATATAEGRFEREILPVRRCRRGDRQGRRGPARHDPRVARPAQAGIPHRGGRRQGDRRQLLADLRRGLGGPDHERGQGGGARGSRRGRASSTSPSPAPIRG